MKNYEEKYRQALKRAKVYHTGGSISDAHITEIIFPELVESEDESIRKEILNVIKQLDEGTTICGRNYDYAKWIAWLEKQKPNTRKREIDDAYLQGICDAKHAIEKQSENNQEPVQKPFDYEHATIHQKDFAPKDEPKFKVGDWVIKNGIVAQILDKQKYGFVGLDIDGKDFFCNYGHTDSMRLWTINDAKDGDVLAYVTDEEDLWIMIYRSLYEPYEGHVHYHALLVNDNFSDKGTCCICIDNLKPATKEQRDLLIEKMEQAGYEWDAEKKELKKMEVASKEGDDERIRKAIHIYLDWLDGRKDYQPKGVYTIRDMIDWVIKQDKKISADKVIAWLVANICDYEYYVKRFKQDFGL